MVSQRGCELLGKFLCSHEVGHERTDLIFKFLFSFIFPAVGTFE